MIKEIEVDGLICGKATAKFLNNRISIYVYLLDDLLIDTGSSSVKKDTINFFKKYEINRVALTHVHEDHAGMASWLSKNCNSTIYVHKDDIEEASHNSRIPLYRRMIWNNRKGFPAEPMPDYFETENYKLDIIPTPGHTENHLSFHEKEKGWIFTGDAFVSVKQRVAFKSENISQAIDSLKRLLKLDFDTIFCAHSGIHKNGRVKLEQKLQNFEDIKGNVQRLRAQGLSIQEINKKLYPKKDLWEKVSKGEWSSYKIVSTID